MIALTMAAHVHRSCQQAIQVMGRDQRMRVDAVAPTVQRALIEEQDRAVIAAGPLRNEARFGRWLIQFVAPNSS